MKINSKQDYVANVNIAKYHNYRYFVLNSPSITDAEYDDLYFAIQEYETAHPADVLPDSPTQKVGADSTASKRDVMHRTPMMSTQKCKTVEDVIKWMKQTRKACQKMGYDIGTVRPFCIEWKYDGCSCSLVYQDGNLIEASTRGDYMKGLNILHHVKRIASIPQTIKPKGRVEVRGEIVMPFSNLEKTTGLYKDCRTAAASILNTDTVSEYDTLLDFYAWQLITEWDPSDEKGLPYFGPDKSTAGALCELANVLDFKVAGFIETSETDIEQYIAELTAERSNLPFPTDGLVIKLENKTLYDALGRTEHHPKYCIAYKFPPMTAQTVITNIEVTTGATGKRTPILYFEPVTMNGKTYVKASGGSEDVVAKSGIKIGSRVQFSLRNDVIPHIDGVIE